MIAALVLGLLNTIVRPLLVLLTLPVTLITLGLFLFVINALMFWAAAGVLSGFNVTGFAAALIGSLIYSLCGMVIDVAVERLFSRDAAAAVKRPPFGLRCRSPSIPQGERKLQRSPRISASWARRIASSSRSRESMIETSMKSGAPPPLRA